MSAGEFDAAGFESAKFTERTREVAVPSLADWFKGGDPVFVVRGLTFDERVRCESLASEARKEAAEKLAAIALDGASGISAEEIQKALGWAETGQPVTRVSIEQVLIACVKPKLTRPQMAKLSRVMPAVFGELLETVRKLTDQGQAVEKKSQPSGQTQASKPA